MGSRATEPAQPSEGVHDDTRSSVVARADGTSALQGRGKRILGALAAVLFWSGLGFMLYSATHVRADPTVAFGVPFILIALEASALTLLFRWLIGPSSALFWVPTLLFFGSFVAIAETRLVGLTPQKTSMPQLLALWGSTVVALLMVGVCLQGRFCSAGDTVVANRGREFTIAGMLLLVAFLLRLQGPVTGAVDEIVVFGEMLGLRLFPDVRFWDISTTANPYLIHWIIFLLSSSISKIADLFVFEKCITAFFASLSIPLWYFAVKVLCNRRVALTAAVLLTFFGWHWVNSRFIYVYPYELAAISLGTLCALLAFGRGNIFAAVTLGLLWTFSILARKISIMMVPFSCYLFLDFLIFQPRISRARLVMMLSSVIAVFIITYLPFLLADGTITKHLFGSDAFFRYHQAANARRQRLQMFGFTQTQAYVYVFKDAVRQLFVQTYDMSRHYFRPRGPLLDPILAYIGSLGFAYSLLLFFWRRECRVALVGLVVFTLPMVLSFPLDSEIPFGISRRMIGASFFLVLLGALGADLLSRPLARFIPRWIIPGIVCLASVAANIHSYLTEYLTQRSVVWITDHGLRRGALHLTVRPAAAQGTTVFIFNHVTYDNAEGFRDLKNISFVQTYAELRDAINSVKSGRVMVVIPGRATEYGFGVDAFTKELADTIPEQLWTPGRTDPLGQPLIFTATLERGG